MSHICLPSLPWWEAICCVASWSQHWWQPPGICGVILGELFAWSLSFSSFSQFLTCNPRLPVPASRGRREDQRPQDARALPSIRSHRFGPCADGPRGAILSSDPRSPVLSAFPLVPSI